MLRNASAPPVDGGSIEPVGSNSPPKTRARWVPSCSTSAAFDEWHRWLLHAEFCRNRHCPICNWRRSLRLGYELERVSEAVLAERLGWRMIMLTLTGRNPNGADLPKTIGELQRGFKRLRELKRWRVSVGAWVRSLEVTAPRDDEFHPHFHVLMFVPPEYCDQGHELYISHAEYQAMWASCMRLDYKPQVRVQVLDGVHEIAKYTTKCSDYVTKDKAGRYSCDSYKLEGLHDGLAGRQMIVYSRNLSPVRKRLGLLKANDGPEDLIHVGDEEHPDFWQPGCNTGGPRSTVGGLIGSRPRGHCFRTMTTI
jgi:plasmid rolling circle replication initiator protein Rep